MDREAVTARLREAWDTLRRVPAHGVPGYRCGWPDVVRDYMDAYGAEGARLRLEPASPRAIDRMHEVFTWFRFLDGQRSLAQAVWLCCGCGMGPRRAGDVLGVHANTARQWRDEALRRLLEGVLRDRAAA